MHTVYALSASLVTHLTQAASRVGFFSFDQDNLMGRLDYSSDSDTRSMDCLRRSHLGLYYGLLVEWYEDNMCSMKSTILDAVIGQQIGACMVFAKSTSQALKVVTRTPNLVQTYSQTILISLRLGFDDLETTV